MTYRHLQGQRLGNEEDVWKVLTNIILGVKSLTVGLHLKLPELQEVRTLMAAKTSVFGATYGKQIFFNQKVQSWNIFMSWFWDTEKVFNIKNKETSKTPLIKDISLFLTDTMRKKWEFYEEPDKKHFGSILFCKCKMLL